jgi:hypothetical protein
MLQFAAMTGIAAMLSAAVPAVAAESTVPTRQAVAAPAKTASSLIKHRASRGNRIAASYVHRHGRRIGAIRSNPDCSGAWCGRQFVLMIGIGY